MNKKILLIPIYIVGLGILLFGLYKLSTLFSPGSYTNAQSYEINVSEDKFIDAINKFKTENPTYIVPKVSINNTDTFSLPDEKRDHWYHVYFYYKKENLIISSWTRPSSENVTTFSFVAINNGLSIGNWKEINKDLTSTENERLITIFETEILNKIKENIKQK